MPLDDEWWRFLTAPFAYVDVGYLFVVAIGLAIFGGRRRAPPRQRRRPRVLLLACGSLGMLAASGIADAQGRHRRHRRRQRDGARRASPPGSRSAAPRRAGAIDQDYDPIGVAVAAAVLLALPIFESTADVFAGLVGGVVGGLAGLAASALRPSE